MDKNVNYEISGIVCDNQECDFRDDSVSFDDYKDWLNKPCPECGENLLTEDDYNNCVNMSKMADYINTFSKDDLEKIQNQLGDSFFKESGIFDDVEGKELLDEAKDDDIISFDIETHNGFKITKVSKTEKDNGKEDK